MIKFKDIYEQLEKLTVSYENILTILDRLSKLRKKLSKSPDNKSDRQEYLTCLKELLNEAQMLPLGDRYRRLIGDRLILEFYENYQDEFNAYMCAMIGEHFEVVQTFEAVICNNDRNLMKETVERIIREKFSGAKAERIQQGKK